MPQTQRQARASVSRLEWEPDMYDVILFNDDFTTMEFVIEMLRAVFAKQEREAERVMLAVHSAGSGVVGTYVHDIALSKADKATRMARNAGYPLRLKVQIHS